MGWKKPLPRPGEGILFERTQNIKVIRPKSFMNIVRVCLGNCENLAFTGAVYPVPSC